MGRWVVESGNPLYVPDEGEEGPGFMKHALAQAAGGLGGLFEDVMGSAPVRAAGTALGAPARAVTAVGHSMAPGGYQGTTDPIDYIMTGEKNDEADLAHYGDLLADTMEAEGTVKEGSAASGIIRGAGELISDPLVLAGVARMAAKPMARAPGLRDRQITRQRTPSSPASAGPGKAPRAKPTKYRQPPADRPSEASQWPSVPRDQDFAAPGVFTSNGVRAAPKGPRNVYRGDPLDADFATGGPAGPGRIPRAKNVPPAAARPLDTDLAYGRGGVRNLPQTKAAKAKGRKLKKATKAMKDEQLDQGVRRMTEQEIGSKPGSMGPEATQPIWMTDPAGTPISRGQVRSMIQSAVENGASSDDIMTLMSNLLDPPVIPQFPGPGPNRF